MVRSNYFHLIVETPKANLSEFTWQPDISYTGYYNRRHSQDLPLVSLQPPANW